MSHPQPRGRLTILDLILLVGGASVGLWIFLGTGSPPSGGTAIEPFDRAMGLLVFLLGGLSVVGPPILIWQRRKGGRRLGAGEFLWFCQGTASWLLWPPIIHQRSQGKPINDSMAVICYFYGTPLMALFVTISLLSGGWLRRRGGRRRRGREVFGLLLGLAWACTGLYILSLIYRNHLK